MMQAPSGLANCADSRLVTRCKPYKVISMSQSKLTPNGAAENPREWFEHREEDYMSVLERLSDAREVTLMGDRPKAAENLRLGYINAVMSIQTSKDRHERAFTAYVAGEATLSDAMDMVVYGNQKADWAAETLETTDWDDVTLAVRAHVRNGRLTDLLGMSDHLKGVSHTKWAFTLAMCGIWEVACIDTNVCQHLGISQRDVTDFKNPSDYVDIFEDIRNAVRSDIPPFLAQWAIYDFERGEHARHMAFYREINN